LGLVVASLSSPYWARVISTMQETAYAHGFHVVLSHTDEDPEKEIAHLRMMIGRHVDGILLASCGRVDQGYIVGLLDSAPILLYDRRLPNNTMDCVSCDNLHGSYIATRHFIESVGIERIACLGIDAEHSTGVERIDGYRQALAESGIPYRQEWVRSGEYTEESGYEDALALLRSADRPRAILACSHLKAVGVFRAAQELRLSIPEDVALIGWDDMPWAPFLSPPLSVITQPVVEMARYSIEKLIASVNRRFGQQPDSRHERVEQVLYRPTLTIRQSCGYGYVGVADHDHRNSDRSQYHDGSVGS
jgi:LacI family transcriptional regulator